MKGREIEDLRNQLGVSVEELSAMIGISPLDYGEYVKKDSIENPAVLLKIQEVELGEEKQNLERYVGILKAQPTGPFGAGKILCHMGEINKLKKNPQTVRPITVEWHLSNRCDHDCEFCTFKESVHHSPNATAIFPDNLIEPTVEDLRDMGVKAVVYSGGGEPLLFPGANRVMKLVKNAKIRQGLITNGSQIGSAQNAEAILSNCDWVRISVDAATQSVYEATHGKNRSLAKTIENIRKLVEMRQGNKPQIGVSFLLTMTNYTDLLPAAKLFSDVGVNYFQAKPIVISAQERLLSGNIFWRTGTFNQLVALPDQAINPTYKVYTLGFKFADMMSAIDRKSFKKCYGHPFYPVITATGEVYVCCLMIGKEGLCYGKISESTRFKDIWNSPKRLQVGESVNVRSCPINCKLSETNKTLEFVFGKNYEDEDFLN